MNWIAALVLASLSMVTRAQTIEYVHTDPLGSPVAITNQAGQVIERMQYEPFGTTLDIGSIDRPGYTGHVMDSLTLQAYMQQRYYDPNIGRFLSVDPVTAYEKPLTNFNAYAYANNNPYRFTDPDGRNPILGAGIGCAVTGPACPAGAVVGAFVGTVVVAVTAVVIYFAANTDSSSDNPSSTSSGSNKSGGVAASAPPPDDEGNKSTKHGQERAGQARSDANRNVGDANRIVREGTRIEIRRRGILFM